MKLKLIALAAVLAAAGTVNAAPIDNGAAGNGGLMFSIWDGANSYSLNLNQTIDSFQSLVAGTSPIMSVALDSTFTSFMATANQAALQWNVVATDISGANRVLETFSTLPAASTNKANNIIRTLAGGTTSFINAVDTSLATTDSAIFAAGTTGYAGGASFGNNGAGLLNFVNSGTLANNSAANGLGFLRIDAASSGIAKSTLTPYAQSGAPVEVWLDTTAGTFNVATVAAVPEPESFAMLLAGLGLMGGIARRRNKNAA